MHQQATEIAPGVTLYTKDGRRFGNAIVVKTMSENRATSEYLAGNGLKQFLIETDFGNRFWLTKKEIEQHFELGLVQTHENWSTERQRLIDRDKNITLVRKD